MMATCLFPQQSDLSKNERAKSINADISHQPTQLNKAFSRDACQSANETNQAHEHVKMK